MKNWKIYYKRLYISWYNVKNELIDKYPQLDNEVYQNNPKTYWYKVFKLFLGNNGVDWVNAWNRTQLIFEINKKMLWVQFRNSSSYGEKGKWNFKIWVSENTHTCCG